ILSVLDRDGAGAIGDDQLVEALRFSQVLGTVEPDTTGFFAAQTHTGGPDAAIAAFPALEADVATYDAANPDHFLVPVYSSQPVVANYPYAVLSAPWVGADTRAAAGQFLSYLESSTALDAFGVNAMRAANHSVRDPAALPVGDGFPATVGGALPDPDG